MHHHVKRLIPGLPLLFSAFLFAACEEGEGFYLEYDSPNFSLAGAWTGSGNDCVYEDLYIYDLDGALSGSVYWPGYGTRYLRGFRSGPRVTLQIDGGDEWVLYCDGDHLSGVGYGPHDNYDVIVYR